jgi:hypothetical protein
MSVKLENHSFGYFQRRISFGDKSDESDATETISETVTAEIEVKNDFASLVSSFEGTVCWADVEGDNDFDNSVDDSQAELQVEQSTENTKDKHIKKMIGIKESKRKHNHDSAMTGYQARKAAHHVSASTLQLFQEIGALRGSATPVSNLSKVAPVTQTSNVNQKGYVYSLQDWRSSLTVEPPPVPSVKPLASNTRVNDFRVTNSLQRPPRWTLATPNVAEKTRFTK